MDSYNIRWKKSATKELYKLDKSIINRVVTEVNDLSDNPFPIGAKKIKGANHIYRIRIGRYRIIYSVFRKILVVEIIHLGHRKDIYKKYY